MYLVRSRVYYGDQSRLNVNRRGVHPVGSLHAPELGHNSSCVTKQGIAWIGDDLDTVSRLDRTFPPGSAGADGSDTGENEAGEGPSQSAALH